MTRDDFLKILPGLAKNYQPSAESLERIKDVCLLIVIGASGVGKSSIIDKLGIPYVPSDVTRPARPEEKNGVDMYFLDDYDQLLGDIQAGRFLQFVVGASGDFYGTRVSSYPGEGWATMPVISAVVPYFRALGFKKTLSVFITPPDYKEWMRRLKTHPVTPEQLQKRLAEAKRSFNFALNDSDVHFVLNDNLDEAVRQVKALVAGRQDAKNQTAARRSAEQIYQRLLSVKL